MTRVPLVCSADKIRGVSSLKTWRMKFSLKLSGQMTLHNPAEYFWPWFLLLSKLSLRYQRTCLRSYVNSWKWKDIILPLFKGASHIIERRQNLPVSWKKSHGNLPSTWELQETGISVNLTMAIINNENRQVIIRNAGARLQRNKRILGKHS